jgi:hypothetical protein
VNIAICTPVHGEPRGRFASSINRLIAHTLHERRDVRLDPLMQESSSLPDLRQSLAELALSRGNEAILWADADHIVPEDALLRLLAHDVPVAGCNYLKRDGSGPTAATIDAGGRAEFVGLGQGLERIGSLGLGFCLTRASVYSRIPKPWFEFARNREGRRITEDAFFFIRLREAGVPAYVDNDLSREIGHLAERVLRF